jgi:hypothetical protein
MDNKCVKGPAFPGVKGHGSKDSKEQQGLVGGTQEASNEAFWQKASAKNGK